MKTLKDFRRFEDDHSLLSREQFAKGRSGYCRTKEDFDKWVKEGDEGYADIKELRKEAIKWLRDHYSLWLNLPPTATGDMIILAEETADETLGKKLMKFLNISKEDLKVKGC